MAAESEGAAQISTLPYILGNLYTLQIGEIEK